MPAPQAYHPELSAVAQGLRAYWLDPRTAVLRQATSLEAPSDEDWLFVASQADLLG